MSQAGVARVLEEHLWETGERSDEIKDLARQLKDRVSRALKGERLSAETLMWFTEAFHMNNADRNRLWDIYSGLDGDSAGIAHTLKRHRAMIRRQCHRTVSLVERYSVDSEGALVSRRTHHAIQALEDGVDIYIFNHEPQASSIEVIHGGRLGRRYRYGGGLTSVEVILDKPLGRDETTVLEYRTFYRAHQVKLQEVRRAAFRRCENVDFAVEFDSAKLPLHSYWCAWDDHFDGSCVIQIPIEIRNATIRQFMPFIEDTVVGFRWEW